MSIGRRRRPPIPAFVRQELYRRAGAVPSFHMAPASRQNAADLITGSVLGTYNSATPAMAVGPDGVLFTPAANAPVIEYDPATLACLGARVWGVVTNLLVRSELIGGTSWTNQNSLSVTTNSTDTTDPKGTNAASKLASGSSTSQTIQTVTLTATQYTPSVYLRTLSGSVSVTLYVFLQSAPFTIIGTTTATVTSSWQRFSVLTSTATAAAYNFAIQVPSGTIYAWGAQLNTGSLAPYVPSGATSASSTADVWDLTNLAAGANNIRSLYARVRTPASGTSGIISLNDNSSSNRIALQTTGTSAKLVAVTSGSTVADITGGTISANTAFNIAARIVGDDYAVSVNGSPVVTDTSGAKAVVDRIFFGRTQAGEYLNGYIEECAGWTQALTNQQLQASAS